MSKTSTVMTDLASLVPARTVTSPPLLEIAAFDLEVGVSLRPRKTF
jgi:hypothetical protein